MLYIGRSLFTRSLHVPLSRPMRVCVTVCPFVCQLTRAALCSSTHSSYTGSVSQVSQVQSLPCFPEVQLSILLPKRVGYSTVQVQWLNADGRKTASSTQHRVAWQSAHESTEICSSNWLPWHLTNRLADSFAIKTGQSTMLDLVSWSMRRNLLPPPLHMLKKNSC